jgi:hypothetical protein
MIWSCATWMRWSATPVERRRDFRRALVFGVRAIASSQALNDDSRQLVERGHDLVGVLLIAGQDG